MANSIVVVLWIFGFGMGIAVLLGAALRYMMLAEAIESERAPAQAMRTITISIGQMIGATLMASVGTQYADVTTRYAAAILVTVVVMRVLFVMGWRRTTPKHTALKTCAISYEPAVVGFGAK